MYMADLFCLALSGKKGVRVVGKTRATEFTKETLLIEKGCRQEETKHILNTVKKYTQC